MKLKASLLLGLVLSFFVFPAVSYAATIPAFSSCVNPQGIQVVSYPSGTHGIIGTYSDMTGADTVYQISNNEQVMQCFCPENGNGIQTNWVKATGFSSDEIDSYTQQGWIYTTNGAGWGLDNDPYLAQNISYSCKPTETSSNSSSSSSSSNSKVESATAVGGPAAQVASVLSLASTGNTLFLYGVTLVGFISLLLGVLLFARKK